MGVSFLSTFYFYFSGTYTFSHSSATCDFPQESQLQLEVLRSWVDRKEPENQITEGPARFLTYPVAPSPAEGQANVVGVRQADLDTGHQLSGLEPRAADLPHRDDDDDDKTLQMAS